MEFSRIAFILAGIMLTLTILEINAQQQDASKDVMNGAGMSGNHADASAIVGLKAMIQNAKKKAAAAAAAGRRKREAVDKLIMAPAPSSMSSSSVSGVGRVMRRPMMQQQPLIRPANNQRMPIFRRPMM